MKRPSFPPRQKLKHLLALTSTPYFRHTGFKEKMSLQFQVFLWSHITGSTDKFKFFSTKWKRVWQLTPDSEAAHHGHRSFWWGKGINMFVLFWTDPFFSVRPSPDFSEEQPFKFHPKLLALNATQTLPMSLTVQREKWAWAWGKQMPLES